MKVTVYSLQNDTLQNKFEYENLRLLYRVFKRNEIPWKRMFISKFQITVTILVIIVCT